VALGAVLALGELVALGAVLARLDRGGRGQPSASCWRPSSRWRPSTW
jgi:hypothetical protein